MIGSVLGKYRIEAELSHGGMGEVYFGRHVVLERRVAIKILRSEMTTSADLVTRFINEAKAASAIRHPSIIEVFDFGYTDEGQAYLVMELLEGETLSARLTSRGRLPEGEAVKIIRSIAGALSAAHAKGIIHRDLKPDNVFLIPDPDLGERAKVLDFGIAKLADHASQLHTQTGALMGTPLYMAPEQARSAGLIDHRADLYSLGCILYELLTGRPPLVAEGTGEIIALHMFTEPEPPRSLVPDLSPALDSIVMRLLAKEAADRFASAAELSDALSVAVGTVPATTIRPAAAAPSLIKATRRRRTASLPLVAAGITILLACVVAVVIATSKRDRPSPTRPVEAAPAIQHTPPPEQNVAPVTQPPVTQPVAVDKPIHRPVTTTPTARPVRPKSTTDKSSPIETDLE